MGVQNVAISCQRILSAMVTMRAILLVVVCWWTSDAGAAQGGVATTDKTPVAILSGQRIYEEDLQPLVKGELLQLRSKEYEIKSRALENFVRQKLLEAESKRTGIPADKVLEQEVDPKVPEPTDAEVEAYYLRQKNQFNRPLDEARVQVEFTLKKERVLQARESFMNRLRERAGLSVFLRAPKWEVDHDPARVRGNANAPITIVEFSDFQCPFCQQSFPVLQELLLKYKGLVKLAYRDFPLREVHRQAESAAEASRCAGEQGKFWEYHDLLFSDSGTLERIGLMEKARTLNVDEKLFESCLNSSKFKSAIEEDLRVGREAGVSGTPAFFINGIPISGAQPASVFERAIEAALAEGGKGEPGRG